ncbi:MAG: DUF1097 domain-containing protein [Ancalomicrobiaceae bacterium]|nr:DUF1097 domain-containing protein [Ancalomicrobiaceae bacterium]
MNLITALAIVIGLLGGAATYVFIGPAAGLGLQIWATFIAWGSFFHSGGNEDALLKSLVGSVWGAICATVALFALTKIGVSPINAGLAVAVSVVILILAAQLPILGNIPAAVYGYASTAGFALMGNHLGDLVSGGLGVNPLLTIVASFAIGGALGYVSGKIGGALAKK